MRYIQIGVTKKRDGGNFPLKYGESLSCIATEIGRFVWPCNRKQCQSEQTQTGPSAFVCAIGYQVFQLRISLLNLQSIIIPNCGFAAVTFKHKSIVCRVIQVCRESLNVSNVRLINPFMVSVFIRSKRHTKTNTYMNTYPSLVSSPQFHEIKMDSIVTRTNGKVRRLHSFRYMYVMKKSFRKESLLTALKDTMMCAH